MDDSLRKTIRKKAIELLEKSPDGIRHSKLIEEIHRNLPEIKVNTIRGSVWNLDQTFPKEILKPFKGLFLHKNFEQNIENISVDDWLRKPKGNFQKLIDKENTLPEEKFYESFADYLQNDLEECTKAIPLGGNKFKDKWGTPDVIGIYKSKETDFIKFTCEVVSVEIKTNTKELITAFGQVCSYKLFSNKEYIVVPRNSPEEDKIKLESLCLLFGIGLVFFDKTNAEEPKYEIRTRATKHEPDYFYANKYLDSIKDKLQ